MTPGQDRGQHEFDHAFLPKHRFADLSAHLRQRLAGVFRLAHKGLSGVFVVRIAHRREARLYGGRFMARAAFRPSRFTRRIMQTASSLEQMLAALKAHALDGLGSEAKGLPPVEKWNPAHCGEAGLEILRDGTWLHEGTRITRESLVRLFSSILRKDADGETYLVTPVEKIRVRVADAHFLATRADRLGEGRTQTIAFTTNVGEVIPAGPQHPIRVSHESGQPRPYLLVRGRLEARILRAPFFDLVEWSQKEGATLGVWSGGAWFELGAL